MMVLRSFTFRITLWYLLVLLGLMCGFGAGVYFYVSHSLYRNLDDSLAVRATQLGDIPATIESIKKGEFEEKIGEVVVLCFQENRRLVKVSPRDVRLVLDDAFVEQAIEGLSTYVTTATDDGQEVRALAVPLSYEGTVTVPRRPGELPHVLEGEPMALVVGRTTGYIADALNGLLRTLLLAIPLVLLVASAGGVFLARRALAPVAQISRTAREIGAQDLSKRIQVRSRDELGRLAETLNDMISRLQNAFQRQREFTADASHELRAPLAVIRAEVTLALQKERDVAEYRRAVEAVAEETGHATHVVEQLLGLARVDAMDELEGRERVQLDSLVRGLVEDVEALCREKGLEMRIDRLDPGAVIGDSRRLREALLNIIDNAVRYTPAGGSVSLSVLAVSREMLVEVSDTGIGIAAAEVTRIFERFYRVDRARTRGGGSGLGLAISRRVVELHGGRIDVESEQGKGSLFRVRLPLAA